MAKYDALRAYLTTLNDVQWCPRLDEIEAIIGSRLPGSAARHRTWWANSGGNLVHQNAWLDAGWRVDSVDLARHRVVFRRSRLGGLAGTARSEPAIQPAPERLSNPELARARAALKEPVTVSLRAEWTTVGSLDQLARAPDLLGEGGGVLRVVHLGSPNSASILIDCNRLSEALDWLVDGQRLPARELETMISMPGRSETEVQVLRSGNAWLLAGGKGRKADLGEERERRMVAELLLLQERQSGRGETLLSL